MDKQAIQASEEREYPHWGRVYLGVIIYTTLLIIGLWLFSKTFA